MKTLDFPEMQRAILELLVDGASQRSMCATVGIHRTGLNRYAKENELFREWMREAVALRDCTDEQIQTFLCKVHPTPSTLAFPALAQEEPETTALAKVVDAEVVVADPPPAEKKTKQDFYDRHWAIFENDLASPILRVESSRCLERNYLREDVLAAQSGDTRGRRPRGISAAAKREVIHSLIGPKPASREDESKDVG